MLFAFVLSNPSGLLLLQLLAAGGCGLWLVLPPPRHTTTTTASSFFPRMAVAQRAIALEMTCATVPHRIWIAFLGKCRRYGDCSGVGVLNCSAQVQVSAQESPSGLALEDGLLFCQPA